MSRSNQISSKFFPIALNVAAKTIGTTVVPVKSMSPPTGYMPYIDTFKYIPDWMSFYENILVAVKIKIKDTFDNIIEFFERPDVIIARIISFNDDVKFLDNNAKFFQEIAPSLDLLGYHNINDYMNIMKNLEINWPIGHVDDPGPEGEPGGWHTSLHGEYNNQVRKDQYVEAELIVEVPYTWFTEHFNVNIADVSAYGLSHTPPNFSEEYLIKKGLSTGMTCNSFIELLYNDPNKLEEINF